MCWKVMFCVFFPWSSNHSQTGMLFYQLVAVQNQCGKIPARKHGPLPLYPPGLCLRHHQSRQWDHWVWVEWEKPLQIIHRAQEQVTIGPWKWCTPATYTLKCNVCLVIRSFSLFVPEQKPQTEDFIVGQRGERRISVSWFLVVTVSPHETPPSADRKWE